MYWTVYKNGIIIDNEYWIIKVSFGWDISDLDK